MRLAPALFGQQFRQLPLHLPAQAHVARRLDALARDGDLVCEGVVGKVLVWAINHIGAAMPTTYRHSLSGLDA